MDVVSFMIFFFFLLLVCRINWFFVDTSFQYYISTIIIRTQLYGTLSRLILRMVIFPSTTATGRKVQSGRLVGERLANLPWLYVNYYVLVTIINIDVANKEITFETQKWKNNNLASTFNLHHHFMFNTSVRLYGIGSTYILYNIYGAERIAKISNDDV